MEPTVTDVADKRVANADEDGRSGPSTAAEVEDQRSDTSARVEPKRPAGLPTGPRRPRNTIWMIAGAALVGVSGVAAASMWSSLSDRVNVLVASEPIADGQIITEADLMSVSIAAAPGVTAMSPDQRADLVGQIATGPIGAGSIVNPAQFMAADAENQPQVIVGAALEPGQYPRAGLLPGDAVKVIETTEARSGSDEEVDIGPREIAIGEVAEVRQLSQSDTLLISIRVDEAISASISDRVAQGRISLALLDPIPDDLIEPADPADPIEAGEPLDAELVDDALDEPEATVPPEPSVSPEAAPPAADPAAAPVEPEAGS
jgi:SAF domain